MGVTALSTLLGERRAELELAAFNRVCAIADPVEVSDPHYADGLKLAVSAALDYGLAALEGVEEDAPPVPSVLLSQARLAARGGVSLDTVLRRYFAGYALLADFLVGEAQSELQAMELKRLLQSHASLFDRLIAAVSEEYERERGRRPRSPKEHRAKLVRRLLSGESRDASKLAYEIEGYHHTALLLRGEGSGEALRGIAMRLDRALLLVGPGEEEQWAWLGGRQPLPQERLIGELEEAELPWEALGLGEPAKGLSGWRLTHRQAAAALEVAQRSAERIARYAEVTLLASALKDELLVESLHRLYTEPLAGAPDGGESLRETLRAYFASGRNASCTAERLGISRQTVVNRLRAVEERLGREIEACAADLEVGLALNGLPDPARGLQTVQVG